jgi:hypothetical protein
MVLERYITRLSEEVMNLRWGVCNTPVSYWEKMNNLHRVSGL